MFSSFWQGRRKQHFFSYLPLSFYYSSTMLIFKMRTVPSPLCLFLSASFPVTSCDQNTLYTFFHSSFEHSLPLSSVMSAQMLISMAPTSESGLIPWSPLRQTFVPVLLKIRLNPSTYKLYFSPVFLSIIICHFLF